MTFDECIEIIDTLEITVGEAKAVEAVAQYVIRKEQPVVFERENFLAGTYSIKLDSKNLLSQLKTTGILSSLLTYVQFRILLLDRIMF